MTMMTTMMTMEYAGSSSDSDVDEWVPLDIRLLHGILVLSMGKVER
jgi:hypothetical protein